MTEPKRAEFKLHKTPPLGKSGPYCVRKGKDGTISVHMGDYVILEGMNATDISDLASLMLSSCGTTLGFGMTQHDIQNQALENARAQWRARPSCACQCGGYGLAGPPNTLRGIFG